MCIRDRAQSIQPGEFRDVDAPGGNIRDAFMPLPFKEPSATLLQLMGIVVQAGQRFAAIADMQVGDGNQQAAVGTTIALLERGSRVMSAIHKRLYVALKQEFVLLADVFKTYLPPEYPYDVVGGQRNIKVADFDDKIDILPVADPNIFSQSQRITLAQTELQLANSNPGMHNLYEAYKHMYQAIGAVIFQEGKPIALNSRRLTDSQTRYTTTERELLAIVETLKEFRNILLGQKIVIHTDHKNVTYANFNTDRVIR